MIRYRVAGRGPVLFVQPPGWGVGAAIYEQTFGPLEEDFTLVYHDPRGSGGSGHPDDPDTLNVAQYAADLDALRAHLGLDRIAVVGHSHGGLIALHYAIHYAIRVSHLLPLAAQLVGRLDGVEDDEDFVTELCRDPAFALALRALHEGAGEAILSGDDATATAFLRRIGPVYFKDQRHASTLEAFLRAHPVPGRTLRETSMRDGGFPVTERAREIRARTLVLAGRYDVLCPAAGLRALAREIPDARLAVFDGSAHFPWLEEPDAFFAAVRSFLLAEAAPRA